MIKIKNKRELQLMREGGKRLSEVVQAALFLVKPEMSTLELNGIIEREMIDRELVPVCKGYAGYEHASCISVNDVVIHGIPSKNVVLKNGDFVTLDVVGAYRGYCVDMARSFSIGIMSDTARRMVQAGQEALDLAIKHIRPGVRLSDISAIIQKRIEVDGFGVIRDYAGHGIGRSMHESPEIPNYGKPGEGPILRSGMTLAIEPMLTEKGYQVDLDKDGWTVRTRDGALGAHVEDTIAVTDVGAEILTRPSSGAIGGNEK